MVADSFFLISLGLTKVVNYVLQPSQTLHKRVKLLVDKGADKCVESLIIVKVLSLYTAIKFQPNFLI